MHRFYFLLSILLAVFAEGCRPEASAPPAFGAPDEAAIRQVLYNQVAAWNAGDVRGFMAGYAQTDSLRFVAGAEVREGWQAALDGYLRSYPDATAMGTLAFRDLDVRPLSAHAALVTGTWHLTRTADTPHGRFTLLFAKRPEGWRIVYDHTSSADA